MKEKIDWVKVLEENRKKIIDHLASRYDEVCCVYKPGDFWPIRWSIILPDGEILLGDEASTNFEFLFPHQFLLKQQAYSFWDGVDFEDWLRRYLRQLGCLSVVQQFRCWARENGHFPDLQGFMAYCQVYGLENLYYGLMDWTTDYVLSTSFEWAEEQYSHILRWRRWESTFVWW